MPSNEEFEALPDEVIQCIRRQLIELLAENKVVEQANPAILATILRIYKRQEHPVRSQRADEIINAARQAILDL
jgi:hypothetical protein